MIDTVTPEAVDQVEWYQYEMLMLQDELDTTLDELDHFKVKYQNEYSMNYDLRRQVQTIKRDTLNTISENNTVISNKLVALSNIVDEYDKILNRYVALTKTKLVTTELNNLRRQGGYLPL